MDVRELDRLAVDAVAATLDGLTGQQWNVRTPCTKWTIAEVVEHMVSVANNFSSGASGSPNTPSEVDKSNPLPTYRAAAETVTAAFAADEVLDGPFEFGPIGTIDGRTALGIHFVDTFVHSWDIGRALDAGFELDEELATHALKVASTFPDLPGSRGGPDSPFDWPKPVAEDAPAGQRLVALLGRDPAWQPAAR